MNLGAAAWGLALVVRATGFGAGWSPIREVTASCRAFHILGVPCYDVEHSVAEYRTAFAVPGNSLPVKLLQITALFCLG